MTPNDEEDEVEQDMRIAYLECLSGISGDMCVAAFLDAGVKLDELKTMLGALRVEGWSVSAERTKRGSLAAMRFVVAAEDRQERHLSEVLEIIEHSSLPASVKDNSARVFSELAEAEARVHGLRPEQVHFHEVGALDSIIDVVGVASCLHLMGIEKLFASTLSVGKGQVSTRHGTLPLPAPAAAQLLVGKNIRLLDLEAELVTPTGAAVVSALATQEDLLSPFKLESVGYGAGTGEFAALPNVLRVLVGSLGTSSFQTGLVDVLETTIDDMNPEVYGFLQEKLFHLGALEVFLTPVQMKKGRPGVLLTVLSDSRSSRTLAEEILAQTTTLGLRVSTERRIELCTVVHGIETPYGKISVKSPVAFPERASPEYEDCSRAAKEHGVPIMAVYEAAVVAWLKIRSGRQDRPPGD